MLSSCIVYSVSITDQINLRDICHENTIVISFFHLELKRLRMTSAATVLHDQFLRMNENSKA